jgi:TRAP transporter TAXI family solute receptor
MKVCTNRAAALCIVLAAVTATAQAQRVVLGGNPQGSQLYPMSNAIAAVVSRHSNLRVDVLPQGGSVFYPMMATEEVDFGMVNPMDALSAVKGEPPYDRASRGRGFPMQTLMLGSPIMLSLVTARSAGVDSVQDLKGRRVVANYGAFASSGLTALAVLANATMSADDVEVVTVSSYPEGIRAVMEGRAVAATGSVGSGIIRELEASRGARFLSIDTSPAAMARVREIGSAFEPLRLEAGPPGVEEDIWVLSYDIPIVVRATLDDDIVYEFAKTVWEHYEELEALFAPLASWTPDRFVSTQALIPYHPGAIRLYREKGVWSEAMQEHQAMLNERM